MLQSFFSCFSCGQKATTVSDPQPITISSTPVCNINDQNENNNLSLIQSFDDAKSKTNTTITFRTTDTAPSKNQDDEQNIKAKIQQVRKKDLAQKKVLQQEFVKQNLIKSKVIYLVEKQWSEQYTQYLRDNRVKELRCIDNRSLLDQRGRLRGDIKQKEDYFIVNERIWKFVTALYGGGPEIARDAYFPVLQLNTKKLQLPPCGIVNPLNLCYLISIMQALLSIPCLNFYLFKKHYLNEQQENNKKKPFHNLMHKFVKQFAQDTMNKKPQEIKEFAAYFESKFNPLEQHDTQEFFLHVANLLQEEIKIQSAQPKSFKDPQSAYYFHMYYNRSIIDKVFAGQVSSVVSCKACKQDSTTYLPFIDLSIQINDTYLEGCLKKHFSVEILELEDLYECEKCKKKSKASKKFSITKTPNYLMIVLKKFTPNGKKIEDKIKYPLQLDVKKISQGNCGQTRFSLMSVIVHKGSKSNKGHYYCYTKRNKKDWCYFNDEETQIVGGLDCLGKDAYMLLYERFR